MIVNQSRVRKSLILSEPEDEISKKSSFIYYEKHHLTHQKTLTVVLNHNISKTVLISIEDNASLKYLCLKIGEEFEKNTFENLEGLRAINLVKTSNSSQLPTEGMVVDFIEEGDEIKCDLIANQYWIKTQIRLKTMTADYEKIFNVDIKLNSDDLLINLKMLLIKIGINYWLENLVLINQFFIYVCQSAEFYYMNKNFSNDDFDDSKVKHLFQFTSHVMKCTITFRSIEEYLFGQFKTIVKLKDKNLKVRMSEFKEMTFADLKKREDFFPEYDFITKSVKNYFTDKNMISQDHWYIYHRTKLIDLNQTKISILDESIIMNEKPKEMIIIIIPNEKEKKHFERTSTQCKVDKNLLDDEKQQNLIENEDFRSHLDQRNYTDSNYPFTNEDKTNKHDNVEITEIDLKEDFVLVHTKNLDEVFRQKPKIFMEYYRKMSKILNLIKEFESQTNITELIEAIDSDFKPKINKGLFEQLSSLEIRNFHNRLNNEYKLYLKHSDDILSKNRAKEINKSVLKFSAILFCVLLIDIILIFTLY